MIYFKKCQIKQPHDFPDAPCKRCNAWILIDAESITFSAKTMIFLRNFIVTYSFSLRRSLAGCQIVCKIILTGWLIIVLTISMCR